MIITVLLVCAVIGGGAGFLVGLVALIRKRDREWQAWVDSLPEPLRSDVQRWRQG